MSRRKRIQPRVDAALWERFRNDVKERKGQTRGVLGDELENAIREYLGDEARPVDRRIENRLARIEQAVGAATTDGGSDTFGPEPHTHTPDECSTTEPARGSEPIPSRLTAAGDEKPAANAATDKKVAYLARQIEDDHAGGFAEIPRAVLRDAVKDEYGFRADTAKRYVERLVAHFDLQPHPTADSLLVTAERRAEIIEARREQERAKADDVLDRL